MAGGRAVSKSIYDLELHEGIDIIMPDTPVMYNVIRVPGGWNYHYIRLDSNAMTCQFVPYHEEFKPQDNE